MPTEKRQRQKEGRRARLQAQQKRFKRRQLVRRSVYSLLAALAITGLVLLLLPSSPPPTPQQQANQIAQSAGCTYDLPSAQHPTTTMHWAKPPAFTLDLHKTYYARVDTTKGTFVIKLDPTAAPQNVNNFVFLASKGFYRCVPFHRVITGFIDQTGDPTGTGSGVTSTGQELPGYVIKADEYPKAVSASQIQYAAGAVAMANSGPHTNSSQFFIVVTALHPTPPTPDSNALAPKYTTIGQVISGLPVALSINKDGSTATAGTPSVVQRVLSVTITTS